MRALVVLAITALGVMPSSVASQGVRDSRYNTVIVTPNNANEMPGSIQSERESSLSNTAVADTFPTLVWEKKPDYPKTALDDKAEGFVETKLYVDNQGSISKVEITQSSGRQDLDKAALEAAQQYRFKPARLNGIPTNSWVIVPFQFRLNSTISTVGTRYERETMPPIIIKEDDKGGEETVAAPKERKKDDGPRFLKIVHPKYTDVAKMQHARAQVDVAVTIDQKGDAIGVSPVSHERDDLVSASIAAAAKCKFLPKLRNGVPVESSTFVIFLYGRDKVMTDAEFTASLRSAMALPGRIAEVHPEKSGALIAFKNEVNSTDTLVIYDLSTKIIRTLFLGGLSAGPQQIVWDGKDDAGSDVKQGVYIYRVIALPVDGSKPLKYTGKAIVTR